MPLVVNHTKFGRRQSVLNMASQGIAFAFTLLLGFFLTPFVVKHIGSTANGFLALSANIMTYTSLIVIALNSMTGRFVAMAYFQHRVNDVKKYYSSVFIANVFVCLILTIPALMLFCHLSSIFHIPQDLIRDVTLLFVFTFIQFVIMQIGSVFNNSAYVANRLDLVASRNIESKLLSGILILLAFSFFTPHLWQLGLIHCLCAAYVVMRNYSIHRMVMPGIGVNFNYFEFGKIRELIASGAWNSVNVLGGILIDQLDLIIVNMFISAAAMGVVSVAKVLPFGCSGLICALASSVAPTLTKEYAEGNFNKISTTVNFNMRLMASFACIPVAFVAVWGGDFYRLWVPTMEARELWLISLAAFGIMPLLLSLTPMSFVFTSANKVKINSLVTIGYALLSLAVMLALLHLTDNVLIRMIIVVTIGRLFGILQGLTFTIPYISKMLSVNSTQLYLVLVKNVSVTVATIAVGIVFRCLFSAHNWWDLAIAVVFTATNGIIISWSFLFSKNEKIILINFLKTKLHLT